MKVYIARETIAPNHPEEVEGVIAKMTTLLEDWGHDVEVGDLCRRASEEHLEASELVRKAWGVAIGLPVDDH